MSIRSTTILPQVDGLPIKNKKTKSEQWETSSGLNHLWEHRSIMAVLLGNKQQVTVAARICCEIIGHIAFRLIKACVKLSKPWFHEKYWSTKLIILITECNRMQRSLCDCKGLHYDWYFCWFKIATSISKPFAYLRFNTENGFSKQWIWISKIFFYPVKLWPGHGHVAVVLRVDAGAAEGFLSEKDKIPLRQTSIWLHLGLVLHIQSLTQLRP